MGKGYCRYARVQGIAPLCECRYVKMHRHCYSALQVFRGKWQSRCGRGGQRSGLDNASRRGNG